MHNSRLLFNLVHSDMQYSHHNHFGGWAGLCPRP